MKKTEIEQGLDRLRPIIQAAAQKRLAEGREVEPPRVERKLTREELSRQNDLEEQAARSRWADCWREED